MINSAEGYFFIKFNGNYFGIEAARKKSWPKIFVTDGRFCYGNCNILIIRSFAISDTFM
jgi:hypothetical protein